MTEVGRGHGAGAFQRRKQGVGIVFRGVGEDGRSRGEEGGSGEGDRDLGGTRGLAAYGNALGILYGSSSDPPLPLPSLRQSSVEGGWGEVGHVTGEALVLLISRQRIFLFFVPIDHLRGNGEQRRKEKGDHHLLGSFSQ